MPTDIRSETYLAVLAEPLALSHTTESLRSGENHTSIVCISDLDSPLSRLACLAAYAFVPVSLNLHFMCLGALVRASDLVS